MTRNEPCPVCRARGGDSRGNNRVLYLDGGWHCFSCGDHRSGTRSHLLSTKEVNDKPDKACPSDVTREVPLRAWKWLLQYGLGWKYWQPYVQWSEEASRLIFTVGTPPEFAIGRFIESGVAGVEGRTRAPPKWLTYGNCHRTAHVFGYNRGNSVVLVEDLISAHKVGLVNVCIPLFGTRVFGSALSALQHMGLPVVLWLDKDQDPHQIKRSAHLSLMTGLKVRYVSTQRDPKELSVEEIQEVLSENRH